MLKKITQFLHHYLSPYFLPRHYLVRDIKKIIPRYNFYGRILDVGCGSQPYRHLFKKADYQGIDFKKYSVNNDFPHRQPDYFFDSEYGLSFKLPFKVNEFDSLVCFQSLEHMKQPGKFLSEAVRIVKPGGLLAISAPLVWPLHEQPNDFFRFTEYGFAAMCRANKLNLVAIKRQGSFFSTISVLANEYLSAFMAKKKIFYLLGLFIYPPFLIFQYFSLALDKVFRSRSIFFNYLFIAEKPKE